MPFQIETTEIAPAVVFVPERHRNLGAAGRGHGVDRVRIGHDDWAARTEGLYRD